MNAPQRGPQEEQAPQKKPKASAAARTIPLPLASPASSDASKRFGRATEEIAQIAIIGWKASRAVLAEPIVDIWAGIFGANHHVEMCGPSYSGKSGLAIGIAVAMANPTRKPIKLLGREVSPMVEGKLALVCNEENSRHSAIATIDRWIEVLGLPPKETWERIALLPRQGVRARELSREEIDHPEVGDTWANVAHAIRLGAFGIAIFDTRARIFSGFGDPNAEDVQAAISNLLTEIADATDTPVIIVSHTKKGADGSSIEDVSGSAQRGGGADVVLMVTAERKDGRVTSSKLTFLKIRDGIEDHPDPVRFTVHKVDGKWTLGVTGVERETDEPAHERIFKLLDDSGTEMSSNEIRKALGLNHATVKDAIMKLRSQKRVRSRETKRNGAQCWVHKSTPNFEDIGRKAERRGKQAEEKEGELDHLY